MSLKSLIYIVIFSLIFVSAEGFCAQKAAKTWGQGKIALYNYHEKEYAEITYRDKNGYSEEGLKRIEHLLRSRGSGEKRAIDRRLIELVDLIRDHFGAETVEVISGYRSPAYNRSLKLEGHGVASESLHTLGQAIDIHLDEVREEDIFNYVAGLKAGGAGIYPRYFFVHVDVGPVRTWREAEPRERVMVGTENNPNASWTAVTDKNEYAIGDQITAKVTNNGYEKQKLTDNVWLEHFSKGEWSEKINIDRSSSKEGLKPGEATEWTWTIPADQPLGKYRAVFFMSKDFSIPPVYSNEFYIRRTSSP